MLDICISFTYSFNLWKNSIKRIMNLELHKSKNLLKILNTAIDAGREIQKVYKKSFNVEIKDDNSPIT